MSTPLGDGLRGFPGANLAGLSGMFVVLETGAFAALNQQPPMSGGAIPAPAGQSMQPDDIRDILPPVEISFWTPGWIALAALAAVLVLLALVWCVIAFMRRRKPQLPPPTPQEVALAALEKLKSEEAFGLESRDFATEVATVLRRFLEATHGIQATRQTTQEFLVALEANAKFRDLERDQLRRFLGWCDQFKFAGESVGRDMRLDLIFMVEERVKGGSK